MTKKLGVWPSCLSPRKAQQNISLTQSVKQSVKQNDIISSDFERGGVSELADEHDLGSCAERHGGSSPPFPTIVSNKGNINQFPFCFMGLHRDSVSKQHLITCNLYIFYKAFNE